jgi:hypothetical protein
MVEAVADNGASREDLVERLFAAFAVQLREIEARVAGADGHEMMEDAKILSGLARTLETLMSLDRKVGHGDDEAIDVDAVRVELAERLERLRPRTKKGGKAAAKE